MKQNEHILAVLLYIMLIALTGCGDDQGSTTGPGMDSGTEAGTIMFTIAYEDGRPLQNTDIVLSPKPGSIITRETNTDGYVLFESLSPGDYNLEFTATVGVFTYHITLGSGEAVERTVIIPSMVTVEVYVSYYGYYPESPLLGTEITTVPETKRVITDENGRALLENIPFQGYEFQLTRNGISYSQSLLLRFEDDSLQVVTIRLRNQYPEIEIEHPEGELFFNIYGNPLTLQVSANDFEDGPLADEQIEWWSNHDGTLGYGTLLVIDRLSMGTHTITVRGIDSNHMGNRDILILHAYGYSDSSYFPSPRGTVWRYAILPNDIIVADNAGQEERWILSDWEIMADEIDVRTGRVTYEVETPETVKHGEYTVVDTFLFSEFEALLSKTTERMKVTYEPSGYREEITIVTSYNPPLVILGDHFNPGASSFSSQAVTATVVWEYSNSGEDRLNRQEIRHLQLTTKVGETETLETPLGILETVPVTVTDKYGTKTTTYARGIGVVATESAPFGFPLQTVLVDTNISEFIELVGAAKLGGRNSVAPVRVTIQIGLDTPGRMAEYCRLLSALSPR
ncbi:hypothetical protein ACFL5H_01245 [Candidatus Latescibacterota bacterium]